MGGIILDFCEEFVGLDNTGGGWGEAICLFGGRLYPGQGDPYEGPPLGCFKKLPFLKTFSFYFV